MPPSVAVVLILTFIESRYPIRFFNSNIAPIILHEALTFLSLLFYFSNVYPVGYSFINRSFIDFTRHVKNRIGTFIFTIPKLAVSN